MTMALPYRQKTMVKKKNIKYFTSGFKRFLILKLISEIKILINNIKILVTQEFVIIT